MSGCIREQPGSFLAAPFLVGADGVGVLQGEADIIEPVQEPVLAGRFDIERNALAEFGGDELLFQSTSS